MVAGKQEYFTDLVSRQEEDDAEPRLFQLSRLNIKEKAAVIAEILCHHQALTGSRISIPGFFGTGFSNIFYPGI